MAFLRFFIKNLKSSHAKSLIATYYLSVSFVQLSTNWKRAVASPFYKGKKPTNDATGYI